MAVYGGTLLWRHWLRSEPLYTAALKIRDAFEREDTGALWYYSDASEKQELRMSRKTFDKVFREYVWPNTVRLKRGRIETLGDNDELAMEFTQFFTLDGREVMFSFVVFKTKQGPKANVVAPAVHAVFDAKYGQEFKDLRGPQNVYRVRLKGARMDSELLKGLGVRGYKDSPPGKPVGSWESIIRVLGEWEAKNPMPGR